MKIIREFKKFLQWRKKQKKLNRDMMPLLSIELKAYTYDECLLAAGRDKRIPHEMVGVVAQTLYCRCSRGTGTLERALSLYGRK